MDQRGMRAVPRTSRVFTRRRVVLGERFWGFRGPGRKGGEYLFLVAEDGGIRRLKRGTKVAHLRVATQLRFSTRRASPRRVSGVSFSALVRPTFMNSRGLGTGTRRALVSFVLNCCKFCSGVSRGKADSCKVSSTSSSTTVSTTTATVTQQVTSRPLRDAAGRFSASGAWGLLAVLVGLWVGVYIA